MIEITVGRAVTPYNMVLKCSSNVATDYRIVRARSYVRGPLSSSFDPRYAIDIIGRLHLYRSGYFEKRSDKSLIVLAFQIKGSDDEHKCIGFVTF